MIEQSKGRIQQGERAYRQFTKEVHTKYDQSTLRKLTGNKSFHELYDEGLINSAGDIVTEEAGLRAVFLGIKPCTETKSILKHMDFKIYGLKAAGDFIYNPDAIAFVIADNQDIFGKELIDMDTLMENINKQRHNQSNLGAREQQELDVKIGVLLGYPRKAVEWYSHKPIEDTVNDIAKRTYGVAGINWADTHQSQPSQRNSELLERSINIADNTK